MKRYKIVVFVALIAMVSHLTGANVGALDKIIKIAPAGKRGQAVFYEEQYPYNYLLYDDFVNKGGVR